jgi:hypothetical protein
MEPDTKVLWSMGLSKGSSVTWENGKKEKEMTIQQFVGHFRGITCYPKYDEN